MASRAGIVLLVAAVMSLPLGTIGAQTDAAAEKDEKEKAWKNATDLSLVVTEGNTSTITFGFKNDLRWDFEKARFRWKAEATRRNEADDRFLRLEPGIVWEPGETPPPNPPLELVEPPVEPDVEIYFTEARYDRDIRDRLAWNVGASWDRNLDAGILSRSIVFAGLANVFWDKEDLKFNISYGLSFTNRDEENPDPEKEARFAGLRFAWDYVDKWGKVTTYENDTTTNMSLADTHDWQFNMTNALSVEMSEKLALRLTLQWLYNNEPALEDVDVVAQVELVDPDGIPGNGDEFFVTVDSGGLTLELGEERVRKKQLDTVFWVSLVMNF